jgi:hypothetical protein
MFLNNKNKNMVSAIVWILIAIVVAAITITLLYFFVPSVNQSFGSSSGSSNSFGSITGSS